MHLTVLRTGGYAARKAEFGFGKSNIRSKNARQAMPTLSLDPLRVIVQTGIMIDGSYQPQRLALMGSAGCC